MPTPYFRAFGLIVVLLLLAACAAADDATPDHPQLVLVLSGGGARGVAHIGVIRVLEELHIAPDLIVGTSMGSIIGGLYAAGWSPDEMEEFIHSIDWNKVFTDDIDREQKSFRRKLDGRPVMIQGRLHFVGLSPVSMPGAIDGQHLELLLQAIEALSPAETNFDKLPIPFRAIATDIGTGEAVVISSGSLATAMRASMSVPGAVPPVEHNGRKLVDGGVAANLPVGIAQELGAQSIIAVDISSPLLRDDKQIRSFMTVYKHLSSLLTRQNRERDVARLGPADLLIVPELGDISFISFDRLSDAMVIGEEAARLQIDELRRFSSTDAPWAVFEDRERAHGLAPIEVDRIRIENTSWVDDRLVRKAMNLSPPSVLDREALDLDLLELYNTRYFDAVSFKVNEIENDVHELVVRTSRPAKARSSLQFGVGFLDDFDGGSSYHLRCVHQYLPVNRLGGEWETTVQIGTIAGVRTGFYQPLDWGRKWFVEPSLRYEHSTQEIWFDGLAIAEYQFRTVDMRLAAGYTLGRWGEFRVAAFTGTNDGAPRIGIPGFDAIRESRGGYEARLRIDTEDSVVFSRSGADVNVVYTLSSDALGTEADFEQIRGDASYAFSVGENTFIPYVEYADNLAPVTSFFDTHSLGGLFRLSGLAPKELLGERIVFARVAGYRRFVDMDLAGLGVEVFAGLSLEAGNAYLGEDPVSWNTMVRSWSVFLGADTFVGPAVLAYGRTETGRDQVYLIIGDMF